jgi:heterodisulfide reductase subunit B
VNANMMQGETLAYYPGCLVLQRMPEYEAATRAVLGDPGVRAEANRRLEPWGLAVTGQVAVKHLVRLLAEREDDLRARIVRPLSLRVALTNPCQVFRPGEVMGFDDAMEPQSMRRLVELTGADVVEYGGENECCGATLYLADRRLSLAAGRRKLEATRGADVLLHGCGNCQLLLRHFQHLIVRDEPGLRQRAPDLRQRAPDLRQRAPDLRQRAPDLRQRAPDLRQRALFLPQLVGLALGLPAELLGLREDAWR